jgi:hypothetical protein
MFRIYFFLPLFFVGACTGQPDGSKARKHNSVQWQYLTLEFNDTVIYLDQIIDTLEVTTLKKGVRKYQIGKVEKDSLFIQANELIEFTGQPNRFCTDYVGKLKLRIRYNSQTLKEISFTSICDWRELNDNTNRIDLLLMKMSEPNRSTAPNMQFGKIPASG